MTNITSQKRLRIYLSLILMLGAILRLLSLGKQSFWYDEVYSAILAAKDLGTVVTHFGQTPTLYHILLHFWLYLGHSDIMIRLLSVVFGVMTLWVIYLVGKTLFDSRHGLLCAFLMAISPLHVWYSQEARMYSLLTLLSVASVLFFLRFLQRQRGWPGFWWAVTSVLAIYTHYYAGFMLVGQVVYFFLFWSRHRSHINRFALALGAVALMVLPIFYLLFCKGRYTVVCTEGAGGNPVQLFSFPYTFFAFSLGFSYGPSVAELHRSTTLATVQPYLAEILPALLLFTAIFVVGLRSLWQKRDRLAFLLLYLFVPIGGAYLVSMVWPQISYNVRYVSQALPAYGFVLTRALLVSRRKIIRWALIACLLIFTGVSMYNHYYMDKFAKEDYRSAAQFISVHSEDGDVVLASQLKPFKYYYHGPLAIGSLLWSPKFYRKMIQSRVHGFQRVWFVLSREWGSDPEGKMHDYMLETYTTVVETSFANIYVGLFEISSNRGN